MMRWLVNGAARSTVRRHAELGRQRTSRSVISLHAHTHHSIESLSEVPRYVSSIPVLSGIFAREKRRKGEGAQDAIDFANGWWRPPVSPRGVFESEARQIEERFAAHPMVSVTDHDSIAAADDLARVYTTRSAPVALEWTMPWESGYFHIGVHNLPRAEAGEWFERLSAFTRGRSRERQGCAPGACPTGVVPGGSLSRWTGP